MPTEQYRFLKTDPSGNTTIFVLDGTKREKRSQIAQALMRKESLSAEQVAFLDTEPPRPADFSFAMMGGEFCGNATRSAAAWLVFDRERYQPTGKSGDKGTYEISCSGIDHNIRCHVSMVSRSTFDVAADMPLPLSVSLVEVGGESLWQVVFDGITHFICPEAGRFDRADRMEMIQQILSQYPTPHGQAEGILFWDNPAGDPLRGQALDPYVYVKDTDTLVNESSCGSGTAALSAALSVSLQKSIHVDAPQKGGTIYGEAAWADGKLASLAIGGKVHIVAEGIVYVEE